MRAGPTGSARVPQNVACVDLTDEELGLLQDTAPPGTTLMAAKMVELVQNRNSKVAEISAYIEGLSDED